MVDGEVDARGFLAWGRFDAAGAGAAGGGGGGGVGEGGNEPDEWRHPLGEVELGIAGEVKRPRVGDPGM